PAEVAAAAAIDDQVVDDDLNGLENFDFHSAADTPGLAVLPVQAAVNIGVDLPGEGGGSLGGDGVLKRVHRVPHSALRIFLPHRGVKRGILRACIIYTSFVKHCKDYFPADLDWPKAQGAKMPRTADAGLEGRVLDAAYRLWSRGGERALTMGAVARAAGTATPTLYQRFRDKRDILELLRKRAQEIMFSYMRRAHTAEEFCLRYFEFAL